MDALASNAAGEQVREPDNHHGCVERSLSGDSNRRDGASIHAAPEANHVAIIAISRKVYPCYLRLVGQNSYRAFLRFPHALQIDELRVIGIWRES
jgi:hypothetical protein